MSEGQRIGTGVEWFCSHERDLAPVLETVVTKK
jgi:hypothetical protein